ncbi:MAG TPA: class I SAM-dependent methyltransferase [Alphaproteobacteria bacterium]|nr:class I SAM-dependent methyltransferase [Alphaproteobacteria bacterium]
MLLSHLLKNTIHIGSLTVIDAGGKTHVFSGSPGPEVTVRLHDRALHRKLFFYPELYIGEAYMDGTLTIEKGTLDDFMNISTMNLKSIQNNRPNFILEGFLRLLRGWQQHNPVKRARANVAHHYDLQDRLYDLFLDRDRQYSCAYFQDPGDDLETAQANKQRHLAAKLLLAPGQRVLDIGSGWGGLALYLARVGEGRVTGLTLSREQRKVAIDRAAKADMAGNVRFRLRDYREETGTYDRIVSVGMFEHVGVNYYPEFFAKVKDLLADDGVCVLHSIGRMDGPSTTCSWIRKYIFPGGYSPALSEVLAAIEGSGLWVADIEILRLHYAETLSAWRRRFQASRAKIAKLFDERFCRMWEFYLALSEAAFRHGDHLVFQIQLSKKRDAVPLTRDYIAEWERANTDAAKPCKPMQAA